MVPKWETLTLRQQCGPGIETKAVHIQGGRNKNNISKNKECLQKMLMLFCKGQFKLSRASSNSAGPVHTQQGQFKLSRASSKNTSGPVNFFMNFEHWVDQKGIVNKVVKYLLEVGSA